MVWGQRESDACLVLGGCDRRRSRSVCQRGGVDGPARHLRLVARLELGSELVVPAYPFGHDRHRGARIAAWLGVPFNDVGE